MLQQACETLSGIGPARAKLMARCGIHSLRDLLFHLPYRYQDKRHISAIQDLRLGDWAVIIGTIIRVEKPPRQRASLQCLVEDGSGTLRLHFFHMNPHQEKSLQEGQRLYIFGEVRHSRQHIPEMIHPEYKQVPHHGAVPVEETLTPIYSTTQGLSQQTLRNAIRSLLQQHHEPLQALEWMSINELQHFKFPTLSTALTELHFPKEGCASEKNTSYTLPALQRLAFEELLAQHIAMSKARRQRIALPAPCFTMDPSIQQRFLEQLPFTPTQGQLQISQEISQDFSLTYPMLRLVQGDVGSGKTLIAALAALQALHNGYQVAFMAPTDLLTEQHAQTLARWFTPLGWPPLRLSGHLSTAHKKEIYAAISGTEPVLLVGTHALFQKDVQFGKLGLIIIDEQHRFGVEQRALLLQKGQQETPHQLVMTATPIPRTLAMTQYSHFDISILKERPQGRQAIITAVMPDNKREPIIDKLRTAFTEGKQAYWVCPLIEISEKLDAVAATQTAEQLQQSLPKARIGLIHGRMNPLEKEAIMHAFQTHNIDILVATTVIEVGVDVPNASIMIIENAERLGLAQLHQLRGRVGRGQQRSYCILLYQAPLSALGIARLDTLRHTEDGFLIAEKDLELRGAGEFLGTQQTGDQNFKLVQFPRDHPLIEPVQKVVSHLLMHHSDLAEKIMLQWFGQQKQWLQS
ncbi:MAG: ATP-dependent DNA helicase RecG [Legionellaceae bacterium]|nr:ATP-dependent DNA helicase RecG [Legionellaceae bacterium]